MSTNSTTRIIQELEYLLARKAELAAVGPRFKIVRTWGRGSVRAITTIWFVHRSRLYQVRLSTALAEIFIYLAIHRQIWQTATQIARGIHGARENAISAFGISTRRRAGPVQQSIKMYVRRVRLALQIAFEEAAFQRDANHVLVSSAVASNAVSYRLKAAVELADVWE